MEITFYICSKTHNIIMFISVRTWGLEALPVEVVAVLLAVLVEEVLGICKNCNIIFTHFYLHIMFIEVERDTHIKAFSLC